MPKARGESSPDCDASYELSIGDRGRGRSKPAVAERRVPGIPFLLLFGPGQFFLHSIPKPRGGRRRRRVCRPHGGGGTGGGRGGQLAPGPPRLQVVTVAPNRKFRFHPVAFSLPQYNPQTLGAQWPPL